ncbi:MAG TPA: cell division protein SepF [Ruminococcaceae bacterium]|nr:cell division protein SepF [Oscillospiraceae bacterium]
MSIVDKFKNFIGIPENDYYDENEEFISSRKDDSSTMSGVSSMASTENARRSNKVVNIHATTQLQVVLVKPERFDDASTVADHLNSKRTVVLNLESTSKDVSRRLIDFLSGVAYANDGQIKRVANSTYIITPYNVDIMGDLLDELENNGVFF